MKSKPENVHRLPVRVYIEDTDAGGIVYYANYFRFAERGRTEMLREAGMSHAAMIRDDRLALAVRRCAAEFFRPARLDEEIVVETAVESISGATMSLKQRLTREQEVLTAIDVVIACVGVDGKPRRLPLTLRQALSRFQSSNSAK